MSNLVDLAHKIIDFLTNFIESIGYLGIIIGMFLESSCFPFPSEVVIIPAGILAAQGKMNIFLVILCGILGSILGAIFNYFLALSFGRKFLIKYGKYLLISANSIAKAEEFFAKHGAISTFIGRLIPLLRQYISLPAGIGKMNLTIFTIFTTLGAGIWVIILATLGYLFGTNEQLIFAYLDKIILATILFCFIATLLYLKYHRRKS